MEEKKAAGAKTAKKGGKDGQNAENTAKKPASASRLRTLELLYQPVFDIHLNMALDFETSMRINDRQMGVLLQDAFLPVAEKTNQVCELNRWNLEEACDAIVRCDKREVDVNRMIIPVSVKYLTKPYMVQQVTKVVDSKGVNSDKICFNISESILEASKEQAVKNIKALRESGFLVSIDDFGVEYTSISHLGLYEVDYIGLSASLIDNIMDDERTQNMIQGIVDFLKKLETQVKVDGVDSEDKAKLLRSMGVDQMKGALYGKPAGEKSIKI